MNSARYVLATFGLLKSADHEINAHAVAALEKHKADKKGGAVVHANCRVDWLQWGGSLSRPTCTERSEAGCTVSVKGQTATITLPSGETMIKRIATRGFYFSSQKESQ
jgi:hypothetical protein